MDRPAEARHPLTGLRRFWPLEPLEWRTPIREGQAFSKEIPTRKSLLSSKFAPSATADPISAEASSYHADIDL